MGLCHPPIENIYAGRKVEKERFDEENIVCVCGGTADGGVATTNTSFLGFNILQESIIPVSRVLMQL